MSKRLPPKEIRSLWARVPRVKCKGLCQNSCGPAPCSKQERELVEAHGGKPLTVDSSLTCSMLTANGRCSVYSVRPLICRMWGAVEGMPCPHGCEVEGDPLPDSVAKQILELAGGENLRQQHRDLLRVLASPVPSPIPGGVEG